MPKAARILAVGAGACPLLSLPQTNQPRVDCSTALGALTGHLDFAGDVQSHSVVTDSSQEMVQHLNWLYAPDRDIGLRALYFSGHAVLTPTEEVALAFANSTLRDPSSLVSAGLLHQYLANCASSQHIWILDCCFAQGLAFKRLPEVVQGMINHLVIASSSARKPSIGSTDLSPFTAILALGLSGLAYDPDDALLSLSGLMDFLAAEADRRRLPPPYIHHSGLAAGLRFYLARPRDVTSNIDLLIDISRRGRSKDKPVVGLGETSDRTKMIALSAGGESPARFWNLDGRSIAMLGMSKTEAGYSPRGGVPLAVEDVRGPAVWEDLLTHRPAQFTAATTPTREAVPDFAASEVELVDASAISGQEVDAMISSLQLPRNIDGISPEDLVALSNGSMLHAERMARSAGVLGRSGADLDLPQVTIQYTMQRIATRSPVALPILGALAAAPGIRLPSVLLEHWSAGGGPRGHSTRALRQLVSCGLVISGGASVMLPSAFAAEVSACLDGADQDFVRFVEFTMSVSDMTVMPLDRFQVIRAATYYCETNMGWDGRQEHVERVISAIGGELFSTARRDLWMPIIEMAETWLADHASSRLHAVIGNAHRLGDSYRRAERSLIRAIDLAGNSREALVAKAGLIRLSVQAGGTIAPPETTDLSSPDGLPREAGQAVADLLNQEGNRALRRDDLAAAQSCYLRARDMLQIKDISTAILAVDIEKGLGDAALQLDRRVEADEHITQAFSLIAGHGMMRLGRVPVAKLLQFSGDVARRRAVPTEDVVTGLVGTAVDSARYWYRRARREYTDQGLDLGALITSFKQAELDALTGDRLASFNAHLEHGEVFSRLDNQLWAHRSMISALKAAGDSGSSGLVVTAYRAKIGQWLSGNQVSSFDRFWGVVSLLVGEPESGKRWSEAASLARLLGIGALSSAVEARRLGNWLFAYY